MASRLLSLTCDAREPDGLAAFWGALLDREVVADPRGPLLAGSETQVGLRFVRSEEAHNGPNPTHLHVTSASTGDQERLVADALAAGASHLDVGQLPEEGHVVLADPEGNAFCVIEPGNGFLAGCGPLGELAGDGSPAVGRFWAEALGWSLVWDEGEETAIQSPAGGTKVAWGGLSADRSGQHSPQRFELVATGDAVVDAEVERLVALGASVLEDVRQPAGAGHVLLADPDGAQFELR